MSAFFSSIPSGLLFLLFIGGSVLFSFSGVLLQRGQRRKILVHSERNDSIGFVFAAVSVVFAVLLGFLVIFAWEAFGAGEHAVSAEAADIVVTARYASSFPEPVRSIVHDRLRHYTALVINDEWPMMQETNGDRFGSEEGIRDLQVVGNVIQQRLPPTAITANALTSLSAISRDRLLRLQSGGAVSDYFWLVLLMGGGITIYLGMLLEVESFGLHLLLVVLLAAAVALCLWLIAIINNPFSGDLQVSNDSLKYALHVISLMP